MKFRGWQQIGEFAGFYRWDAKKQAGWSRLFFCDQADLKRYSRLKIQTAAIDASGAAVFFPVSEHPKENKSGGGLGVNKRNRGYPADFEFIERPLNGMT